MLIAVMSDRAGIEGRVPDTFEKSAAVLVVETDTNTVISVCEGAPAALTAAILAADAEAVVCGKHIGKDCFTPIADACITRYDGTGLDILSAALGGDRGTLPLIPDYEGGTGCGSGTGECHDHGFEEEE